MNLCGHVRNMCFTCVGHEWDMCDTREGHVIQVYMVVSKHGIY